MAKVTRLLCIVPLVVALVILPGGFAAAHGDEDHSGAKTEGAVDVLDFSDSHNRVWRLKGSNPFLIGGYGDNFSYDGSTVTPLIGKAKAVLDAEKNTGSAKFTVFGTVTPEKGKSYTGDITLYYRVGSGGPAFQEGGVADFIYLHGGTGQDAPVMPRIRTFLGSWGSADVYINGKLAYPNLMAHIMYTERGRDPVTQAVYNSDRSGFYSPKDPTNGSVVDSNGRELHFVAHSMKADKGNFPPHTVWFHINFEAAGEAGGNLGGASCGITGCGCGCADGGACGCAALGKSSGKTTCGVAGCGCGCADGGACGCAAVGKGSGKAACGVAGCGCGCADGGACGCAGNVPTGPAESPQAAPKFDM